MQKSWKFIEIPNNRNIDYKIFIEATVERRDAADPDNNEVWYLRSSCAYRRMPTAVRTYNRFRSIDRRVVSCTCGEKIVQGQLLQLLLNSKQNKIKQTNNQTTKHTTCAFSNIY